MDADAPTEAEVSNEASPPSEAEVSIEGALTFVDKSAPTDVVKDGSTETAADPFGRDTSVSSEAPSDPGKEGTTIKHKNDK